MTYTIRTQGYSVGGVLYDSRRDAIRAAIEWWGTACGTQPLDPAAWSAGELRELAGWCVAPAGVDQEALDAEVIAAAAEYLR